MVIVPSTSGESLIGLLSFSITYIFVVSNSLELTISMFWVLKGEVGKWRAVKVVVKEENDEEMVEDEHESDESDGEEVIQSR